MDILGVVAGALLYIALGRMIVGWRPSAARDVSFAALNVAGVYLLFFPFGFVSFAAVFVAYIGLAAVQYAVLRAGAGAMAAFAAPIVALIGIKMFPYVVDESVTLPNGQPLLALTAAVIGISYFAFRTSYLTLEVRNGYVAMPTFWQYLGFCFFTPTMAVGPINRYSTFRKSLDSSGSADTGPMARAAMRLLVGAVKFRFVAGILNQLTYSGLLLDGHPHHWIDLLIGVIAYYAYLYCNFSGFCDMAVGAAGLMGISVEENFKNPFGARNMREFWNRWHVTLGMYMRDVVFTPMSKRLSGVFGPRAVSHATAIAIATVFVLIGVWHGPGLHYIAFGVMHAVGVVWIHYYTLGLKRWLGRDRFRAYNSNPFIHAVAVCITFTYAAASHFLFANSFADMARVLAAVQW